MATDPARKLALAATIFAFAGSVGCSSNPSGSDATGGQGGGPTGIGGTGSGGTGSGGATATGTGGSGGTGGTGTGGGGNSDAGTGGAASATDASTDGGGGRGWLTPPEVPSALAVPAGATVADHFRGVGAQVYTCTASGGPDAGADAGPTSYAWVLKTPDAKLYDELGLEIGFHSQGPTWTSSADGSSVVGARVAGVNSPLSDAIQWLLLRASANTGTGVFSTITYIQRLETSKGKAPATGCDGTTAGTDVRVFYSAEYYFFSGGASAGDGGNG